jgi:hypothetical protein
MNILKQQQVLNQGRLSQFSMALYPDGAEGQTHVKIAQLRR